MRTPARSGNPMVFLTAPLALLLVLAPAIIFAKQCPTLIPPLNGVLKCQFTEGRLQCMATCYQGHLFDTQEPVVIRTCDPRSGQWLEGSFLPVCSDKCEASLLTGPVAKLLQPDITMSTDSGGSETDTAQPLWQRVLLTNRASWRPAVEDLGQFVQIDFNRAVRINGVILRGDLSENYVTAFRVLFSRDGNSWYPYTDGGEPDKIFAGNTNANDQAIRTFSCPHEARYVRINPVTWSGHPALALDILGCPLEQAVRRCKPVQPPRGGAVNCELDGEKMMCTAYCLGDTIFANGDPVLTRTCYESIGQFGGPSFPDCIGQSSTLPPKVNVSGFCMEIERDCSQITNGDYQYCGDCHYFSTCSHGYLYIRACPALLKFDSINGLCDYHSRTCQSKHRRFWLAERRMNTYWDLLT